MGSVEKYRKAYEVREELATKIAFHVLELAKKDALKSISRSAKRSQGNK